MDEINWFHSIPLDDGTVTPGLDSSMDKLEQVCLPKDLSGKTVLDIGAWDGFFSFQAEKAGAERVLATDHFCWSGPGWGTKDGFNFAHKALNSKVESLDIDAMDISPDNVGKFDVVMFLGVLYHLSDPMGGSTSSC
jgi:Predicted methyltransferase